MTPMTVAVSCNLSDGVILGVDSAVSAPAPGGGGIAKIYAKRLRYCDVLDL
jgi:hypothetical protein